MKIFVTAIFLCLSAFSYGAEYTPARVPTNLHVYTSQGATYVDMLPYACSGTRYYLSPSHEKYDAIFSMLMAAQIANRPVVLRIEGCVNGSNPQGNIVGVYLK